ncbi:hypothetical protein GGG16DRAFT_31278, partial [Schizophyllum commune]
KTVSEIHERPEERRGDHNPQTAFKKFKDEIFAACRERMRIVVPRLKKEMEELKLRVRQIENDREIDDEQKILSLAVLQEKLEKLEMMRYEKVKTSARARNRLEGEVPSIYWSSLAKEKAPRDTIARLKIPGTNPPRFVTRSSEMADTARGYHDELQRDFEYPLDAESHAAITREVLEVIDVKISDDEKEEMDTPYTEDEVREAIRAAPLGKAAGINGIPAELWQELERRYQADRKAERPTFNIAWVMAAVYNDIQDHGVETGTDFELGWMCPLYKKKDRSDIANYRPITLLNTDYKILTKCMALRL